MPERDLNDSGSSTQPLLKQDKRTWSGIRQKLKLLAPYLWPHDKVHLQICIVISFIIQAVVRILALLIPIFFKKIVDDLSKFQVHDKDVQAVPPINATAAAPQDEINDWPWHYIIIYVLLKSLIGSGGYLTAIRNSLWQLALQHQRSGLHIKLFRHIHSLSMSWHVSRKTGEVIKVMERGVTGCVTIINVLVSQIIPIIFDVTIAIFFFFGAFDALIGLVVFLTLLFYALVTVLLSEWRTKYRRARNDADNHKASTALDSILNVETVKIFSGETWEVERFSNDTLDFEKAEWWMHVTANMYASARVSILNLGFLIGCIISARYVTTGYFTPGDFVLFASYLIQLFEPLNMLGANYRMFQQGLIDMENMFDILETKPEITDTPSTMPITVTKGSVQFENVSFSYSDSKQILNNVSFTVNPGETLALVGKSGVGKTTIGRLLLRLFDIQAGKICVDGREISDIKLNSLRHQIGIVPQDPALFNHSAKHNIQYGKMSSTMTDIMTAARGADIHNTISSFPQGYETVIGEKGIKLSGGERQRIAIARMLLKNPKIVILDEATSALDSGTERAIQTSLLPSCEGRTTIIITHRLSSIVNADNIIVFEEGKIVESGKHGELLRHGGTYAKMFALQQAEAQKEHIVQYLLTPPKHTHPTGTLTSVSSWGWDRDVYSIADIEEVTAAGQTEEELLNARRDSKPAAGQNEMRNTKNTATIDSTDANDFIDYFDQDSIATGTLDRNADFGKIQDFVEIRINNETVVQNKNALTQGVGDLTETVQEEHNRDVTEGLEKDNRSKTIETSDRERQDDATPASAKHSGRALPESLDGQEGSSTETPGDKTKGYVMDDPDAQHITAPETLNREGCASGNSDSQGKSNVIEISSEQIESATLTADAQSNIEADGANEGSMDQSDDNTKLSAPEELLEDSESAATEKLEEQTKSGSAGALDEQSESVTQTLDEQNKKEADKDRTSVQEPSDIQIKNISETLDGEINTGVTEQGNSDAAVTSDEESQNISQTTEEHCATAVLNEETSSAPDSSSEDQYSETNIFDKQKDISAAKVAGEQSELVVTEASDEASCANNNLANENESSSAEHLNTDSSAIDFAQNRTVETLSEDRSSTVTQTTDEQSGSAKSTVEHDKIAKEEQEPGAIETQVKEREDAAKEDEEQKSDTEEVVDNIETQNDSPVAAANAEPVQEQEEQNTK